MGAKNIMINPIKASKTKYLAVFATTTLIFVIGLFFGNYISNTKLSNISLLEEDFRIDILALEVQYALLAEDPCAKLNSNALSDELYTIGSKLDYMENKLGETDKDVLRLKEYYSLLELRRWLFLKKQNKECGIGNDYILYFYSNLGNCKECKEQGFVLNFLHKKHPELSIYSFDINIDNIALRTIKELYKVSKAPSLVINEKEYDGFKKSSEIESILARINN